MQKEKAIEFTSNPKSSNIVHKTLNVVFVDDNEEILELLNLLVIRNYKQVNLFRFRSAEEALFFIILNKKEIFIDVIFSDYHMSNINGIEFFEKLQEHEIYYPFILLTALTNPLIRENCYKAGIKHFYKKEFSIILDLFNKLDNLI
ncbi:MAG: hypothetical protein HeimC3_47210 [Candidatus Heimdallarchaeota archaeon LC_3]|nr:MAG: hypothetical protein HeimC3_47210 [Candidatus Heimdallarchaeota archaeon LC_3]